MYITVLLLVILRLQDVHTLFRQYHDKSGIEIREKIHNHNLKFTLNTILFVDHLKICRTMLKLYGNDTYEKYVYK